MNKNKAVSQINSNSLALMVSLSECASLPFLYFLVVGIIAQFTLCVVRVPPEQAAAFYLVIVDQVSRIGICGMVLVLVNSIVKSFVVFMAFCASNRSDDMEKIGMLCAAFMKNAIKTESNAGSADVSYAEHTAAHLEMTKSMTELIKLEIEKCKAGITKTESSAGPADVSDVELNAMKLKDEISPVSESSSSCSAAHTLAD